MGSAACAATPIVTLLQRTIGTQSRRERSKQVLRCAKSHGFCDYCRGLMRYLAAYHPDSTAS